LPEAVTLKRFATDLRVLLRAIGLGIGAQDSGDCLGDNFLFTVLGTQLLR